MKQIPLTNGGFTIVDDDWYDVLARFSWWRSCKGYAQRGVVPGGSVMMHQIVNMTPKSMQTDHINGDKLDNRRANLRCCTNAENSRSRKRKVVSKSGYRGVQIRPNGRFGANIMKDYKRVHVGMFDTVEDAARAYDKAAVTLHRSFASLNFPEEHRAFADE